MVDALGKFSNPLIIPKKIYRTTGLLATLLSMI